MSAATPELKDRYVEVNGVRLHYVEAGSGPLILFLHGFPEFWYEWKNQLEEFGKTHHAVAPDQRGYNLSSRPEKLEDYRIDLLVEDIRSLAAHLLRDNPNKKFTLVAHDWGGAIAWIFAARYPAMLDHLVIVNAPHPTVFARELRENPAQQKASQYMLLFRSPQAEATLSANNYEGLVKGVLGGRPEADQKKYLEAWAHPGGLTGGLNWYRASQVGPPLPTSESPAGGSLSSAALPVIKVPTLVIWGEKDTALLTGNLDGLDKQVEQLTIRRVPDATHWIVAEQPVLINTAIREFTKPK